MINILKQELTQIKELQEFFGLFYCQFSKSSSYPCKNRPKGAKK